MALIIALFTEWLQGAKKVSWSACCGASTSVRVISINWKKKTNTFCRAGFKKIINYHLVIIIHFVFTLSWSDQLEKHFLIHMNLQESKQSYSTSALRIPPKTKKLHLPNGQVKIRIHKPDYKVQPRATGHNIFFARWIDTEPWEMESKHTLL